MQIPSLPIITGHVIKLRCSIDFSLYSFLGCKGWFGGGGGGVVLFCFFERLSVKNFFVFKNK